MRNPLTPTLQDFLFLHESQPDIAISQMRLAIGAWRDEKSRIIVLNYPRAGDLVFQAGKSVAGLRLSVDRTRHSVEPGLTPSG